MECSFTMYSIAAPTTNAHKRHDVVNTWYRHKTNRHFTQTSCDQTHTTNSKKWHQTKHKQMETHTNLSTVHIELIQHKTNEHPQAIDHSISTNSGHKQTICPRGNCIPGGDSESRVHPTIIDVFDCVVVMVNDVSA